MKDILTKGIILAISITSIGLASCSSSNTQQQNTGAGAVTGAVVGGLAGSLVGGGTGKVVAVAGGAIAGALLGGYIGHNWDHTDTANANNAMNNSTNQSSRWKSSKGARYTMTPTSGWITVNGNPNCRRFMSTAVVNGQKQRFNGIACRQADGSWVAMK